MVPQDQGITVGFEILRAVLYEGCQGRLIGHSPCSGILLQADHLAVFHLPDLIDLRGNEIVTPVRAAAGIHDYAYRVAELRRKHFLQILRTHGAPAFQVSTAHIDHQGKGVFVVAFDSRIFGTTAGCHAPVDGRHVRTAAGR